jgi:ATP-dependent RNA helicase DeaD
MRPLKRPNTAEVLKLFKAAGFNTLTPLQQKLVPLLLSGKDIAVSAEPGSGKTAGFLLPLMLMTAGERLGTRLPRSVRAAIVVLDPEEVRKITREHLRFSRVMRDPPSLIPLGDTDTRREQRRLETSPVLIAGTAERIIDHIRRGGLALGRLDTVVIERTGSGQIEDFLKDVHFIFAKLPPRRQVVLFSGGGLPEPAGAGEPPAPDRAGTESTAETGVDLLSLLRRPVVISSAAPAGGGPAEHSWFEVGETGKADLLARVLLAQDLTPALVYHSGRIRGDVLARECSSRGIGAAALSLGMGAAARKKLLSSFSRREVEVLCVPYPAPAELDVSGAAVVVYHDLPPARGAPSAADSPHPARFPGSRIAFVERNQARDLAKLQETLGVSMKQETHPTDEQMIRGSIERIMRKIREEENPEELAALRSLIRKQVPLLMRSTVAAYLLKSQLPRLAEAESKTLVPQESKGRPRSAPPGRGTRAGGARGAGMPPDRGPPVPHGREPGRPQERRSPAADNRPPEGKGRLIQLFVSVGRNRRVFPKDLSGLFTEKLRLQAGEIGHVRVFDKYSFVEISSSRAEEAIARLSGTEFKGRPLLVNYAKKKEEKELP